MAKEFTHSANDSQTQVQVELLELLLSDNATYPWNTTELESEAYFADREQGLLLDWSEEEMAIRLHFFSKLEEIWSDIAPTADTASPDIPRDVPQNE